jgi:predicted ester cyclase
LRRAPLDLKPGYRPDFIATTTERPTLKGLNIVRHLLATATIIGALFSTPVDAVEVRIDDPVIGKTVSTAQNEATMKATKAFYRFWNTGDETVLKAAIAPTFTDHTLPPGRPQGPEGPSFASKNFRTAVPDLGVEVKKLIVAGDYVTVHMEFKGHFTGTFGTTKGQGQAIDFIATDLLKVTDGRITDNWHIEDNLTLLSQMGVATLAP